MVLVMMVLAGDDAGIDGVGDDGGIGDDGMLVLMMVCW
jgi:hypothetical protein